MSDTQQYAIMTWSKVKFKVESCENGQVYLCLLHWYASNQKTNGEL